MHLTVKYSIQPKQQTVHACEVIDHFGIGREHDEYTVADNLDVPIEPGDIVCFTGASGAGKSSLMRAAATQLTGVVDMQAIELPDAMLIDGIGLPIAETLELLSACGLCEAQLMLRTPAELSDGQRYRYRLAYTIARGAEWILADEFTAPLDRTLAKSIAFNLGRLATKRSCGFLLATTHDDILGDLQPTIHVRCRLDGEPVVVRNEHNKSRISFAHELTIGLGTKADWPAFARWHYRGKHLGFTRKVFLLHHGDEIVGICVFTTPCVSLRARNRYFGVNSRWKSLSLRALNAQLATLSRVVLHPTYRGIGIASQFVRRCCELMPFPWIETLTEMGHINPFFERAGFQRVGVCRHAERSLAEHSAIYGGKRKNDRRQQILSQTTHDKSRHSAPVYYIFDNRGVDRQQARDFSNTAEEKTRLPLFIDENPTGPTDEKPLAP